MAENSKTGWIGVDLDGTLAHYEGWNGGTIGEPIPAMLERVKSWIAEGREVRIFTARVHGHLQPLVGGGVYDAITPIEEWCRKHIGHALTITNVKDFGMVELWDDRAVQVIPNTGSRADGKEGVTVEEVVRAFMDEASLLIRLAGSPDCDLSDSKRKDYAAKAINGVLWRLGFWERK